ncbi:MAG: hypothetical protein AAF329_00435 [Cyanobacteria bacterium P01_A01_bin.17]
MPYLLPLVAQKLPDRLTFRQAIDHIYPGRSLGALHKDCQFLGIDTAVRGQASLTQHDCWVLYVFLCWRCWRDFRTPEWSRYRSEYEVDCCGDDGELDPELQLGFVDMVGGSTADFEKRWNAAIAAVHEQNRQKQKELKDECRKYAEAAA